MKVVRWGLWIAATIVALMCAWLGYLWLSPNETYARSIGMSVSECVEVSAALGHPREFARSDCARSVPKKR